jgi:hypothetical protein
MKSKNAKRKKMTLEDLAVKMTGGFVKVDENHESLAQMVAKGFERAATKRDLLDLENKLTTALASKKDLHNFHSELKAEIEGLRNAVNNYLRLSDERYLELKAKQKILAKYLKLVIQKFKMPIDIKELEIILK